MSLGDQSFHSISEDYEAQLKLKELEIEKLKIELSGMLNSEIERLNEMVK